MFSKILSASSSEEEEEEQAKDRLSNLQADILAHILSFLPIKFAATTSVLSKRWKFFFHSLSHIDLDEAWQNYPSHELLNRWEFSKSFYKFVYNLLLSPHTSPIKSLRLRYRICHNIDPTHDWIVSAILRRVEELTLFVDVLGFRILPVEIFNCKTIRVLRIHGSFYFDVPSSVNMPNLVELHLEHVKFLHETYFDRICSKLKHLSLCHCNMNRNNKLYMPNLVELHLEHVMFWDETYFDRISSKLKLLSLCHCNMNTNNKVIQLVSQSLTNLILRSDFDNYRIALHTPNLVCLDCKSSRASFLTVMEKLSHLTSVSFRGPHDTDEIDEGYMAKVEMILACSEFSNKFMETIDKNVKFLRLSGYSLKVLCFSTCRLPTFHNLTSMELGVNHSVGWKLLAKLLKSSPNLEVLSFDKGFVDHFSFGDGNLDFEYCLPETVPTCLLKNLRQIKVGDFRGGKCEYKLIEYFLRSGKVLEEVKICSQRLFERSSFDDRLLEFFCWKLSGYPKCSKTCKIVMSWKIDGNLCERITI